MSLVPTRKRKDFHNPGQEAQDKGKVRVVERSVEAHPVATAKRPHARNTTPAGRTFTTLRRGSIRIFSIFRNGKSKCLGYRVLVVIKSDSTIRLYSELSRGYVGEQRLNSKQIL